MPNEFNYGFAFDTDSSTAIIEGSSNSVLSNFGVFWGLWDNASDSDLSIYDSVGIVNDVDNYDTGAALSLFVRAEPAYYSLSTLTGKVRFDNVTEFIGTRDDGQPVRDVIGGFDLNLGSGDVTNGTLTVCFGGSGDLCSTTGTQHWNITGFDKIGVAGSGLGLIESESVTGTITVDGITQPNPNFTGDIYGFTVADSAEKLGFVLGFTAQNSGSADIGSRSIIGGALLESAEKLSQAQIQSVSGTPDFGFVLLSKPIDSANSSLSINAPLWGWTNDSQTNPILLTTATPADADTLLLEGADYFDPLASTPVEFNTGFKFDTGSSSATFDGNSNTALAAFGVSWGLWNGTDANATQVFDTFGLKNKFSQLDTDLTSLLISAEPAYTGTNLVGNVRFDRVTSFIGVNDLSQPIRDVIGGFDLALDTGTIANGFLTVCFGASTDTCDSTTNEQWVINGFDGDVAIDNLGLIESESITGNIYVGGEIDGASDINGNIYGFMLDDSASKLGFVLGFNLSNSDVFASDGSKHVIGGALLEEAEKLTQAQIQAVSNSSDFGFLLVEKPITNTSASPSFDGPIWGWANGSESSPLLLTSSGYNEGQNRLADGSTYYDPSATTPNEFDYGFKLDTTSDSATFEGSSNSTLSAFGVSWGLWDGADSQAIKVFDPTGLKNNLSKLDTEVTALLISAAPAYTGTDLVGNVQFDSVSDFIGVNDNNDPIRDVTGGFDLDLGTGAVSYGSLTVCFGGSGDSCSSSGVQKWEVTGFNGNVASPNLGIIKSESVTGSISVDGSPITNPSFAGDIYGFMVEDTDSTPGFVLGFDLANISSSAVIGSKSVIGGVLLEGTYLTSYDSAFRAPYNGFGFALSSGIGTASLGEYKGFVGNAIHGASSAPSIISFAGNGSFNNPDEFFNSEPLYILEGSTATRDTDYSVINASSQTNLNWSLWDDSASNSLFDNIASGFDETVFTDNLLVVTTTSPAFKTSGTYTFADTTQTRNYSAIASLGELNDLTGSFDVDFSNGNISNGNLQLSLSGDSYDQSWSVAFTGQFSTLFNSASQAHLSYLESVVIGSSNITDNFNETSTDNAIEGDILGLLTTLSEGGPGFAGGFNLFEAGNANNNVFGAFLWGNDNLLTAEERIGMSNTRGMFVTSSAKVGDLSGIFGGPAFFNSTAGNEVFTKRTFSDSTFNNKINLLASAGTVESVFRSGTTTTTAATSSNGIDRWGNWQAGTVGTNTFNEFQHSATGNSSDSVAGDIGYWFIGDPIDANDVPATGSLSFGGIGIGTNIIALQGSYSYSGTNGTEIPNYQNINADEFSKFSFDLNFATGDLLNGQLDFSAGATALWRAGFTGSLTGAFINASVDPLVSSNYIRGYAGHVEFEPSMQGQIQGYLTGSTTVEGAALAFNLSADTFDNTRKNTLFGTVLLGVDINVSAVELPPSTTEEYSIAWGKWDNPIEQNWVVVEPQPNGQVDIQTSEHLASVTPTPIANLTGTGNYESTIASSFIGRGSAGDVTQVVAGMAVDFNTGSIANGSLQVEVANSQAWQIDFSGTVNAGLVELNSTAGVLIDPGGIISNSIDANLGGVFTGDFGEAFVGGFELVDQINSLNHVNGIYTIENR